MVHPSARVGFEDESGVYATARPSYHPDLIERFERRMRAEVPFKIIVDRDGGSSFVSRSDVLGPPPGGSAGTVQNARPEPCNLAGGAVRLPG